MTPIKAWLGLTPHVPPLARICAKCPDKTQAEEKATAMGYGQTHSLCPQCACDTWNEEFQANPPTADEARAIAQALATAAHVPIAVMSDPIRLVLCPA